MEPPQISFLEFYKHIHNESSLHSWLTISIRDCKVSGVLWSVLIITHHNNNPAAILRVEVASLPGIASMVSTHHALSQTMDRCMTHCSESSS